MDVEYREVKGFPKYRVGNDGSFWKRLRGRKSDEGKSGWYRNHAGWKRVYGSVTHDGYLRVTLHHLGKSYPKKLHILVCEAFHGPRPEGMEVRHFPDRNPLNCRADNLSWSDRSTNLLDRNFHGTSLTGEFNPGAVLTLDQVKKIRAMYVKGHPEFNQHALARRFGVGQSTIGRIVRRTHWVEKRLSRDATGN